MHQETSTNTPSRSSVSAEILRLAVPSILANITIPIVGIVDVAIAGHIAQATAIGGIAIGTMLFDLLYWNFGFLRVGTAGMTAQAYGKQDRFQQVGILTQGTLLALIASIFIWIIQYLFVYVVLLCIPCSPEVALFARKYFFIRIWAAPATMFIFTLKGWFIGMQNTWAPMITDIVINLINMLVSYLLAVRTPIGAIGVAYGTLIAQYCGLTVALIILFIRYFPLIKEEFSLSAIHWYSMRKMLHLNANIFVRSLCFMIIYVGFTAAATHYGDQQLAISTIMMKLFMLFSYFIDGFAYAGEALTGKMIGSQQWVHLKKVVSELFIWTCGIGLVCTLLYAVGADWMFNLMTSDAQLTQLARPYRIWLILMPLISSLAFLWDGIYIGATEGKIIRNCMIYAAIGFVISYFALQHWFGIQALYIAYFVHLIVRVTYLSAVWKPTYRKLTII